MANLYSDKGLTRKKVYFQTYLLYIFITSPLIFKHNIQLLEIYSANDILIFYKDKYLSLII